MANSNFETTMKQGGKAIDEAAWKTGQRDALTRVQDGTADLDDMVSEQVGRHPKAMVALGVGIGFALGMLFATSSSRAKEPGWRDYARW